MREGPIKVRLLWDYWTGSLRPPQHNPKTPRTRGRTVESSHLECGWSSVSEFDTNCRPVRVPCWRWSWTTTWGWKSSLQLEWSQFPPARKTAHQSQRWALSAPAAVLFLSHAAGDASNIPVVYPSDVLSAALTRALPSLLLLPLARQRCADSAVSDTEIADSDYHPTEVDCAFECAVVGFFTIRSYMQSCKTHDDLWERLDCVCCILLLFHFPSSPLNLWYEQIFTGFVVVFLSVFSASQLIQSDLDDEEDERLGLGGGRGTLRFKHKLPVELKGPEGVHVVHGSTGTLLTSDLNSLPEDDQRALARSLEALNADGGLYNERNARTESAKSTPMHRHKDGDVLSESPLEITELWLAEASLVWAQPWQRVCPCVSPLPPWQGWARLEECV